MILDPEVTRHTPMWLFLSTGIRAVDHCVEGVCSNELTEFTNASALHGLSLLARGLPRVKADPADMEARLDCQIGSWLSMGAAGGRRADGRQPRHRLRAGRRVRYPARPHVVHHAALGDALEQIGQRPTARRWSPAAMGHPGKDAGDVLDQFIRGLGMPRSLGEVKVGKEHFERIAKQAMGTPWVPRNPRPIDGPAEVREILELAA